MNVFQSINAAAVLFIVGGAVAGLAKHLADVHGDLGVYAVEHREIAYLAVFIIVFRIKTLLDDHKHFGEIHQDKSPLRFLGFILAVFSWFVWAIAAYLVPNTIRSAGLMALSIAISTAWIIVHVLEILADKTRRNAEILTLVMREKWGFINVGYIICLLIHVGLIRPVVEPGNRTALLAAIAILVIDALTSRSLGGTTRPNPAPGVATPGAAAPGATPGGVAPS